MARSLVLTPRARRALDDLAADLGRVFGPRVDALVAYAGRQAIAFVSTLTADDLDACAALADMWRRHGVPVPLLMTPDEFRRSLDAFPLEYQAMLDEHVVIAGTPPFAGIDIDHTELRRACEAQARGFLLHLRQAWIDSAGHKDHLARMLAASAPQLRALLGNVAHLGNRPATDLTAIARDVIGLPADLITDVLALEHAPDRAPALVGRLREYLAAAERLWAFIDAWQQ